MCFVRCCIDRRLNMTNRAHSSDDAVGHSAGPASSSVPAHLKQKRETASAVAATATGKRVTDGLVDFLVARQRPDENKMRQWAANGAGPTDFSLVFGRKGLNLRN